MVVGGIYIVAAIAEHRCSGRKHWCKVLIFTG